MGDLGVAIGCGVVSRLLRFGEFSLILGISATNERKGEGFPLSFCFPSIGNSLLIVGEVRKPNQKERKQSEKLDRHYSNLARRVASLSNGL